MSDKVVTIEEQTAAKIIEAMATFSETDTIKEGIEKMSGLPNVFVPLLTAIMAERNGLEAGEMSDKVAPFAFDLVLTALAIGYAHGLKQATETARAASDSAS